MAVHVRPVSSMARRVAAGATVTPQLEYREKRALPLMNEAVLTHLG